jgi:hypothetical protein
VVQRLTIHIIPVGTLWRTIFLKLRLCWRHLKRFLVQGALEAIFDGLVSLRNRLWLFFLLLLAGPLGTLLLDVGKALGSSSSADDEEDRNADRDEGDESDGNTDACFGAAGRLSPCKVF